MTSLTQKDLEAISAYIDQALNQRERTRLEERFKREPELLAELNSMRRTRRILRSAPPMRAPRNFTLTPDMVGAAQSQPNRLLPVTRFAFALASIFFVFTLVGRFTLGNVAGVQTEQSMAYPAAEGAPMAPEAFEESVAEDTVIVESEVLEQEAPAEAAVAESADMPMETQAEPDAAAETTIIDVTETVSKEPGGGGGFQPEPTLTPAPDVVEGENAAGETSIVEAAPVEPGMEEEARTMDVEEGEAMDEELAMPMVFAEDETAAETPSRGLDGWGLAALISGVLAAVSGGASLLLRKRMK